MQLNLSQELTLRQELRLTPKLIQMFKILHLPYSDLLQEIRQKSEENPMLELTKEDELLHYAKVATMGSFHQGYDSPAGRERASAGDMAADDRETLFEYLSRQVELEHLPAIDKKILISLIEQLDEHGYLRDYPKLKNRLMAEYNIARTRIDKNLTILQSFEPEGIGARDLKECLWLQLKSFNFQDDSLTEILTEAIKKYLPHLHDAAFLTNALNITEQAAKNIADFIETNLTPYPAQGFNNKTMAEVIIPSFELQDNDQNEPEIVNLEDKYGPSLRLSPYYLKTLEDPKADSQTKEFIRQKLKSAKDFLENIAARKATINKIIEMINERQKSYFLRGSHWLNPLQQNTLAEQLGVSPSTISRAVSGKYLQLPGEIIPLKYLLPRNVSGFSARRIQAIMADVWRENPLFSDQQLSIELRKHEIMIKRRTVAKYRQELAIPSTRDRGKEL